MPITEIDINEAGDRFVLTHEFEFGPFRMTATDLGDRIALVCSQEDKNRRPQRTDDMLVHKSEFWREFARWVLRDDEGAR